MAAMWAMVAIAAGSAIYGASESDKAQDENQRRAELAAMDETERRNRIADDLKALFEEYNNLREERPGMSIEEYVSDRLKVLNNPELKATFRRLTSEDFAEAQRLADMASAGNIATFNKSIDVLSGGFAKRALSERNRIVDETNADDAYARAYQLYSSYVPVGSVEQGEEQLPSRASKGAFQVAYEVDQEQTNLRYNRLNEILNADRNLALSQQEKARDFLPVTSFVNYATNLHQDQRRDQLAMQLADESFLKNMISSLTALGYTDMTRSPTFRNTDVYDKMVADGTSAAIKSAANIYSSNSGSKT